MTQPVQRWWDSLTAMRRTARIGLVVAVAGIFVAALIGSVSWETALLALFVAAGGIVTAMFAGFRASHLSEIDRLDHR